MDRAIRLEKIVLIDHSIDSMVNYFEAKGIKLHVNSYLTVEERKEIFAVTKNCLEDTLAVHLDKELAIYDVQFSNTPEGVTYSSKSKWLSIGPGASADRCRVQVTSQALRSK